MMRSTVQLLLLVSAALFHNKLVNGFGIVPGADSFHVMQTAAAHLSHTLPHIDLLSAYKQQLATHPLPTKMMTGATLAVCGDAIAQSQDKTSDYDTRRASSFAVFDMAYRALQHVSFPIIIAACHGQYLGGLLDQNHVLDVNQWAAMEQTLASQLGIVPFFYYPVFFALTGAIQGLNVQGSVTRAQEMFVPLMKRNLLFWIPVQFVQFGYIQEDLQIPFLSVCGLFWTFILSVAAGSTKNYTPQQPPQELLDDSNSVTLAAESSLADDEVANAASY